MSAQPRALRPEILANIRAREEVAHGVEGAGEKEHGGGGVNGQGE